MQGFNMGRYVPPDEEGVLSGNQVHKRHALGSRASKLSTQGILTVRFEMPFAVWCTTCTPATIIGQGTRFNAEKKKVGAYHSTPILSFRMRHGPCGGTLEIRTDPANTAYVVYAGGKKRDVGGRDGDDSLVKDGDALVVAALEKEREDQRESAFKNLEKTIADRAQLEQAKLRIDELQAVATRDWEDPYARNQRLRRAFRQGRKAQEKDAAVAEELKDRMSLGIDLLPETAEDARRAGLVDFGETLASDGEDGEGESEDGPSAKALARPLFDGQSMGTRGSRPSKSRDGGERQQKGMLKAHVVANRQRQKFVSEIMGNTRASKDPFLDFGVKESPKTSSRFLGVKRKRDTADVSSPPQERSPQAPAKASLVTYESDSD